MKKGSRVIFVVYGLRVFFFSIKMVEEYKWPFAGEYFYGVRLPKAVCIVQKCPFVFSV